MVYEAYKPAPALILNIMQGEISGILDHSENHNCINDYTVVNLLMISSLIMFTLWLFGILSSKWSHEEVARSNNRKQAMIAWDIQQQRERIQQGLLFFLVFINWFMRVNFLVTLYKGGNLVAVFEIPSGWTRFVSGIPQHNQKPTREKREMNFHSMHAFK